MEVRGHDPQTHSVASLMCGQSLGQINETIESRPDLRGIPCRFAGRHSPCVNDAPRQTVGFEKRSQDQSVIAGTFGIYSKDPVTEVLKGLAAAHFKDCLAGLAQPLGETG